MKRILKKSLTYVAFNGLLGASIYYGFYVGIPWVANFATFGIIAITIIAFLAMCIFFLLNAVTDKIELEQAQPFLDKTYDGNLWTVPKSVDMLYDVLVCCALVYTGHIPLAVTYLFQTGFSAMTRELIDRFITECKSIVEREEVDDRLERLGLDN